MKKSNEDLEEAQESIGVYEEMMATFTKKQENDLQEFADLVYTWKGKAKEFNALEKTYAESKKQLADAKAELAVQQKAAADAKAALKAAKASSDSAAPIAPVAAPVAAVDGVLKAKYEQALKDLDAAKSKIAGLEKDVKTKEAQINDLKSRLQVAMASASSSSAAGPGDEDPLIEMVEKLMKEMEEMARENEEYLAKLEQDLAGPQQQKQQEVPKIQVSKVEDAEKAPAPPKPVASAQPTAGQAKPAVKK